MDPLNLPMWRKQAILICMSLHPFVVNFTSSSLSSALPIYASTPIFGLPPKGFSELTYLIAVNVLMMGVANLWWVPLANTFGRRSVTLLSLLLLVFSSMWAGLAKTFHGLLAARLVMGIASAPADAVSPDVVGEIFFVHQRGRAMVSLYHVKTMPNRSPLTHSVTGYLYSLSVSRIRHWRTLWRLHRCSLRPGLVALGERYHFGNHLRPMPCIPG